MLVLLHFLWHTLFSDKNFVADREEICMCVEPIDALNVKIAGHAVGVFGSSARDQAGTETLQ